MPSQGQIWPDLLLKSLEGCSSPGLSRPVFSLRGGLDLALGDLLAPSWQTFSLASVGILCIFKELLEEVAFFEELL